MVKRYREEICKVWCKRGCIECDREMMRWGFFWRTDVRDECGKLLQPLPVQRWRCPQHGTCSFLPAFLLKFKRYLTEVVGRVCDRMAESGRVDFPEEVTGPSVETARRWLGLLRSPTVQRWLLQRQPTLTPSTTSNRLSQVIELARSYACQMEIPEIFYPRLLQRASL